MAQNGAEVVQNEAVQVVHDSEEEMRAQIRELTKEFNQMRYTI